MPYVKPPSSPESTHSLDLPPLKLRAKHRRTRSANPTFSDERGPGAFVSISIPRRKSATERKALFHFDDAQEDSDSSDSPRDENKDGGINALKLTVDTKNVPSNSPSQEAAPTFKAEETSSLPFPSRGSPLPSPQPPSPSYSPLPRTPSTPIILSNGKPLKPSLKSSHSSPHVPGLRIHMRAQSEPATPSNGPITPKNVHFAGDESLRSVRVFNKEGKPVNVSRTNAEETETETEYDSSAPNAVEPNAFPFPRTQPAPAPIVEEVEFELESKSCSPVPSPRASPYANVHVETLVLPRGCPPILRGSVIVRNIAFAKDVAVRFTMDDWQTTSEVGCKYVASLPSLPPPFPTPHTHGDKVAAPSTWDRFSFSINLEDFERKLHEKTMFLVARFSSPGSGEWWDNNDAKNYCVRFQKRVVSKPKSSSSSDPSRLSPVTSHSQQRTFSAPSTLKSTPTTEAVQAVAQGRQAPPPKIALPPQVLRAHRQSLSMSLPPRPSPPIRHNSSPQSITLSSLGKGRSDAAKLYASVPSKLNLMNYAAPSTTPSTNSPTPRASDTLSDHMVGMSDAAPVLSPGVMTPSPAETPSASTPTPNMHIVGGMPATAPKYELSWSNSTDSSTASLSDTTPPPLYSALPLPSDTEKQRAKDIVSSPTSSLAGDSMYAAFVKQWCFVQSPTPSPTIHTEGASTPTPPASSGSSAAAAARVASASAWRGMDAFFGSNANVGVRSDSPMLTSR